MNTSCIIIPVHNRRDTTLACLDRLKKLGVYEWADVVVVDDGSTDGTRVAIEAKFPAVVVLAGDGNLWWAGGTNVGMKYAFEHQYDRFFWLNDDCRPVDQTLKKMNDHCRETGEICTALSVTPSGYAYGGQMKGRFGLHVDREPGPCDTFGGNCVCFPVTVIRDIGYLDAKYFPMDPADADYGLRAKKFGYKLISLAGALCESDDNLSDGKSSWLFSDVPLRTYLKNFFMNRNHISYIPTKFRFHMRHWGIWGVLSVLAFYIRFMVYTMIRILMPRSFLKRFAKHSVAARKQISAS
jgi:GT2 family glycosyltransferase